MSSFVKKEEEENALLLQCSRKGRECPRHLPNPQDYRLCVPEDEGQASEFLLPPISRVGVLLRVQHPVLLGLCERRWPGDNCQLHLMLRAWTHWSLVWKLQLGAQVSVLPRCSQVPANRDHREGFPSGFEAHCRCCSVSAQRTSRPVHSTCAGELGLPGRVPEGLTLSARAGASVFGLWTTRLPTSH